MGKKEIQEQPKRGYFIEATKQILRGEGIKSISVRNIADQAGYSYATMYNYFKDVKELIFECVLDFQEECTKQIKMDAENSPSGTEKINSITKSYMKYFVQYPGIFELFFLEGVSDIGSKQSTTKLIYTFLDRLCEDEWNYCVREKIFTPEESKIKAEQIKYVVTGLLLFYINRRDPNTYTEFSETTKIQLDHILNKY